MNRIKLNDDCKQLLIALKKKEHIELSKDKHEAFTILKHEELLEGEETIGDNIVNVILTEKGKAYLYHNPKLRNPLNWDRVISIVALLTAVLSLVVSILKK